MSTLVTSAISKRYGRREAVRALDLDVAPGEVYGLVGVNGAGKTTTLGMVGGLLTPDEGTVEICGINAIRRRRDASRLVGHVPQHLAIYPDRTALYNCAYFARLFGMGRREARAAATRALELVDLADRAGDMAGHLSGGMQRRVNLAVALVHAPRLVLLDEPTVGVDPQTRRLILDRLRRLADDGVAIVIASHYIEEIERICDRVGVIDHGTKVQEGSPAELIRRSQSSRRLQLVHPAGDMAALDDLVAEIPVAPASGGRVVVEIEVPAGAVADVIRSAAARGVEVIDVGTPGQRLEDALFAITGDDDA